MPISPALTNRPRPGPDALSPQPRARITFHLLTATRHELEDVARDMDLTLAQVCRKAVGEFLASVRDDR